MGYWLYAQQTNSTDTVEHEVTQSRSGNNYVMGEIQKAHPECVSTKDGDREPTAVLPPEKSIPLFEQWLKDLTIVTAQQYDDYDSTQHPDARDVMFGDAQPELSYGLSSTIGKMLDLAKEGYTTTFVLL
jgi:hypothetical protein